MIKIKMNINNFLQKLAAGAGNPAAETALLMDKVGVLVAKGVTFTLSYHVLMAHVSGDALKNKAVASEYSLNLMASVPSVMNNTAISATVKMTYLHVEKFIGALYWQIHSGIKSDVAVETTVPAEADAPKKGKAKVPEGFEKRVPLWQATHINQPVNGSSEDSMYRCIGVGPGIAIAARLKGPSLSIRVEGPKLAELTAELHGLGIKYPDADCKDHMSAHYKFGQVPPERIIGAVLMIKGVKLVKKLQAIEDLMNGV